MTELCEMLYSYAAENLVVGFRQDTAAEARIAQHKARDLTDQLSGMAPGAKERVERLKEAWDEENDYHSQAIFLSGLSIGLELGRL